VALGAVWLVGVVCLAFFTAEEGPKGCWVDYVTGYPCPTCGSSRAGFSLVKGDVASALAFNPLVTLALVAGVFVVGIRVVLGRQLVLRLERRGWVVLSFLLLLAVALNWIYVLGRFG